MCSSLLSLIQHAKEKSFVTGTSKMYSYEPDKEDRLGIIRSMQQSYMMRELEISWFYYNWKNDPGEILCFSKYLVRLDRFIGLLSDSVYSFGRLYMIHKNDKKSKKNMDTYERQKDELKVRISQFIIYLINLEFGLEIEENFESDVNTNLVNTLGAITNKNMIDDPGIEVLNEYYVDGQPITSENLAESIKLALRSLVTAMFNVMMTSKVNRESDREEFKNYGCSRVDQGLERTCVQRDQNNCRTSFDNKHPFPNIDDARVMQFISKYCVSTSSLTSFIKTQEAAVQLTDISGLSTVDIKKLSWDSDLMCSFNKVHSIIFKLLFLVIKKKFDSRRPKIVFLTSITEKILHYLLPHMILSFISDFNGLFNENESLGSKLCYNRPIENSQALSILYSSFHLEAFCSTDGEMLPREQSVNFCVKSRPLSNNLYDIMNNHDGLISLMQLTTLTNLTEGDYTILSADAPISFSAGDGGTSQILYDVVFAFFTYLTKNDKRDWETTMPRKWMTRTELKDKSLRDEMSDMTRPQDNVETVSAPASGGRQGVRTRTTRSMERGSVRTTGSEANNSVSIETAAIDSQKYSTEDMDVDEVDIRNSFNDCQANVAKPPLRDGTQTDDFVCDHFSLSSDPSIGEESDPHSVASRSTALAGDEILSDCDKGNEGSDRFNMNSIKEGIKPLVTCLAKHPISDLSCPCGTGKNHTEFELNGLASFFENIVVKQKLLKEDMMFLDIGSGKGVPQFLLWYLYKIPSHGIEISPFYTKVALQALIDLKELKSEEDVKVSFSCIDLVNIKSLDPYRFIMCSLTGYVHSM